MHKVLVGLSGGVDSAVAAYLLKQQGYDVAAAFMRNWDSAANNDFLGNPTVDDEVCPQEKDYQDAQKVAEKLGIELYRIDFIKEYWDEVFMQFLSEYRKGRTPNPDILCNKYIKFDAFFNFAREKGFEKVATGHYARVAEEDGIHYLLKGIDTNKDQSYFLSQIKRDVLKDTLFPVGDIDKPEVRRIAAELDLPVAEKKDSTGICFIGERNFKEFLQNYLPAKDGGIIDIETGEVKGTHIGVLYYTLGQRKGLGIGGDQGRWFVAGKNVEKNELYVANSHSTTWLNSDSCLVSGINWLADVTLPFEGNAKFRYRQKDNPVIIEPYDEENVLVRYPQQVASVTPGQQAVFYDGDRCLGGGVIEKTFIDGSEHEMLIEEKLRCRK
ncbi:MAG: tRNA 2-thiouridine(34) synthase MnmA [Erysipelotrichaceae bacterium]|nr:tRNA 2-thiouridine(34) synthase MnmA [Erysipelotrichaceae bacterium]